MTLRTLAILGGTPLFHSPLHVNRPNLPNRERLIQRIDEMLARRWFSDGQFVQEFESRIARITETRYCVATCNGTAAIEITLRGLGLTGEVIVPSFTFAATVQALRWLNLTPVFCDVRPDTHCIDPQHADQLVTEKTSAILGVHLWGHPCDTDALELIASKHKLPLVYDAAHALGSSHAGRPVGGLGNAEVFSFHATKFINTTEGGAITTNDAGLADRLRSIRDFGFDANDQVVSLGTNGKMSELCASMGLTYLDDFDSLIDANRATFEAYCQGLSGVPGLSLFTPVASESWNAQYIVAMIDPVQTRLTRDEFLRVLTAENVLARKYFHPGCHRLLPLSPEAVPVLPVTEQLSETVLVLPGGASVQPTEVAGVCAIIRQAIGSAQTVRQTLADRIPFV